jgi:hypothetical protein
MFWTQKVVVAVTWAVTMGVALGLGVGEAAVSGTQLQTEGSQWFPLIHRKIWMQKVVVAVAWAVTIGVAVVVGVKRLMTGASGTPNSWVQAENKRVKTKAVGR